MIILNGIEESSMGMVINIGSLTSSLYNSKEQNPLSSMLETEEKLPVRSLRLVVLLSQSVSVVIEDIGRAEHLSKVDADTEVDDDNDEEDDDDDDEENEEDDDDEKNEEDDEGDSVEGLHVVGDTDSWRWRVTNVGGTINPLLASEGYFALCRICLTAVYDELKIPPGGRSRDQLMLPKQG